MPEEWQEEFVKLLDDLDDMIDWRPKEGTYRVQLFSLKEEFDAMEDEYKTSWDKELDDPLKDYDRGRRRIPFTSFSTFTSFQPDWASPPGDTIEDILIERGLSWEWLASEIISNPLEEKQFIQDLKNGTKRIDEKLAFKLSHYLGSNKRFWLQRDENFVTDLKRLNEKNTK